MARRKWLSLLLIFSMMAGILASFGSVLAGTTCRVALDLGHGGSDPGAVYGGVREKDVVWNIGNRVATLLRAQGCTVALTRSDSTNPSWTQRWQAAYAINAQVMVSIHTNAFSVTSAHGTEAWWQGSHSQSSTLARILTDTVSKAAGLTNRGVKVGKSPYSSSVPSALIEMAFLSNTNERSMLVNRPDLFAQAIANSITSFLGYKPVTVTPPPTQRIHIVQRGETLYRISLQYKVTVAAIVTANRLPNANLITVGQRLIIP